MDMVLWSLSEGSRLSPRIISIDRPKNWADHEMFEPHLHYPNDKDLDERSFRLTRIDLAKIQLVSPLEEGVDWVSGSTRRQKIKDSGLVRLDAGILVSVLRHQEVVPLEWAGTDGSREKPHICFDGSSFLSDSRQYVYGIHFAGLRGVFEWERREVDLRCDKYVLSAVLSLEDYEEMLRL